MARRDATIVQITDTHILQEGTRAYGVVDTAPFLERAGAHIRAMADAIGPVDAVVATGDLTDLADAASFARFRALLGETPAPLYVLPGNHDGRDALRAAFPDHGYLPAAGHLDYHVRIGDLALIGLDTLIEGASGGALGAHTLDWLDARLAEIGDLPLLVAMHHPPVSIGVAHMDAIGLNTDHAAGLAERLARRSAPTLTIAGHLHRTILTHGRQGPVLIAPSTAHAVTLDFRADAPATFTMEPPGVMAHRLSWDGDAPRFTSHFSPIGAFDGPHPFFPDAG